MDAMLLFVVGILFFVVVQMGKRIAWMNANPRVVSVETVKEVTVMPLSLLAALLVPIDINGHDAISVGGIYFAFMEEGRVVVKFDSYNNKWVKTSWGRFADHCKRNTLQLPVSGQASVIAAVSSAPVRPSTIPQHYVWDDSYGGYGAWVAP